MVQHELDDKQPIEVSLLIKRITSSNKQPSLLTTVQSL